MIERLLPNLGLSVLMAVLLLVAVRSIDAAPDDRNSATWYRRSFERLETISHEDWEYLYPYWENPTGPPPPGVREVMARARPAFERFRRGSMQAFTDFELAYEDGIEMRLPHLAQLRTISKLMRYDLLVKLHDGDSAAAAEHVATLYRMSQQLSADRTIISTLVGQAIFSLADGMATIGFDRGVFNVADSESMLKALEPLATPDPFGMVSAMGGERDFFVEWIAEKYSTADARAVITEEMPWMDAERSFALGSMSDEEFAGHVEGYRQLITGVQTAMAMEPKDAARAELARLEAAVEAGEYGILVLVLAPSFTRAFDRMEMTRETIASRVLMLRDVTAGRKPLGELANAAFFYIRAAEAARRLDEASPEALEAFRVLARDATTRHAELDEAARTVLDEGEAVMTLVAEGASKERCDFAAVGPSVWLQLAPAPLIGLCDAARFLHVDTRRLIRDGDVDAATARLATCYGLSAHLSTHESLLAAMLAHTTFLETQQLVEREFARAGWSEEHRVVLLEAARRIPRADPFGYTASVVEARKSVSGWLGYQGRPAPGQAELQQQIGVAVESWGADRLLFIESVHFQLERAGDGAATVDADPLRPLADLLAPDAMQQIADDLGPTASAIRLGEIEILEATLMPPIARVAERRRTAGRDLKRGLRFLEGAGRSPEPAGVRITPTPGAG